MGQKISRRRRRNRGVAGQSSAVYLPMTPPTKSEDERSSVGAARSGRVISPRAPPTGSRPLSAEKERSESALAPTAALSLSSLDSGVGWGRCAGRWYTFIAAGA